MSEKPLFPASGREIHRFGPASPDDPREVERVKANYAAWAGHRLELLKSVVTAGETGFKTLLVINGAAAVAVLAFLGNVLTKEAPSGVHYSIGNIKMALLRYALGVALVGVGIACRFLSLYAAMLERGKVEVAFGRAALLAGLASLAAFVLGGLWVVGAVS